MKWNSGKADLRTAVSDEEFAKTAYRVSLVGIFLDLGLSIFKFIAGFAGHSGAMISDAVHSASDVAGSIIVIAGVRMSSRASDSGHPYGHERMESVASIVLSSILAAVGILIGYSALTKIFGGNYDELAEPGLIALLAAVISIGVKEGLFWYTRFAADRIHSGSLKAEAWHHRSDALSSIGSLIGIAGARLGVRVLDPIASLVIAVLILKVAYDIFRDATDQMVDHAAPPEKEQEIRQFVEACPGVDGIDVLRTREFGRKLYVDLEIRTDGDQTLRKAHAVAESVHDAMEKKFPDIKHVMIHINPD